MNDTGFEVSSQVLSAADVSLAGLRVVAVDAPGGKVTMLLTAKTDADGRFTFDVSVAEAMAFFRFARPGDMWNDTKPLHLSVYNGTTFLQAFVQDVSLADFSRGRLPDTLSVDLTGTAVEEFQISGHVLDVDGQPRVGVTVTAHRIHLGAVDTLGAGVTGGDGAFTITYDALDHSTPTATKLDLQLVVLDELDVEIGRSAIVFDAAPIHRVDVVVGGTYRGRSEFERITQTLAPWLSTTDPATTPKDIAPHEIELLAQKTDLYPPYLAMYVQAARLAHERDVTAEVFYALLRAQLPADLPALLATRPAQLRSALEAAYTRRIVPAPAVGTVEDAIDAAMEELDALIVDGAMVAPGGGPTNVRALLDTSGLPQTDLEQFYRLWLAHEGSHEEFWATVAGDSEIGGSVGVLRFTSEATALTRGYLPALDGIQALRVGTTISAVSDLAAWDVSDWVTFLTPLGAPDDLPGVDETARVQFYAEAMNRIVEERYPTQVLARRLERDTPAGSEGVYEFLDANPSFDIRSTVIPMYLEANPGALPGGVDPGTVETNLKAVQRLWSLTPTHNHYDVATVLIAAGLQSATEIASMGQAAFVDAFATALDGTHPIHDGPTLARSIYSKATVKSASAVTSAIAYLPAFNSTPIPAIQTLSASLVGDGAATLTGLFGSIDYCGCEHCRSVLSPAAYFVDLLALLQSSSEGESDPLATLTARRPDLGHIELSCTNTNTVMPYIDLVNELLEQAVLEAGPPYALTANPQTTWAASDLRLFPEHRNYEAYTAPASEVYPWSLPMDLPTVELRAYLERLGVSRVELMRMFQVPPPSPVDGVIAGEALGMTTYELGVFDGAIEDGGIATHLAWNLPGAGFATTLAENIAQLLATAGLEFDEMLALFTLRSVVGDGAVTLSYADYEPSCDLADISLEGFTAAIADRMHRFLRLARHAKLSFPELDVALRALGGTNAVADLAFLDHLGELLRLRDRSGFAIDELCSLWGAAIDTRSFKGQPSLYERLFLSRQVAGVESSDFALDPGNPDELAVAPEWPLVDTHYGAIRAGLQINDDDLQRLVEGVLAPASLWLDMANLSALLRHVTLARLVGLRIEELLAVLAWSTVDPFASPASTIAFMDLVAEIDESGMSVAELDYLFRHEHAEATGIHPSTDVIDAIVDGILAAIGELDVELTAELATITDERAKTIVHLSALGVVEADIKEWLRILALGEEGPVEDFSSGPDATILTNLLADLGVVGSTEDTFIANIDDHLASEEDTHPTATALLVSVRRQAGVDALVAQHLANATGLAPEAAEMLANDVSFLAVDDSTIQEVLVVGPSGGNHTQAVVRLHKAAMVIKGLGIRTADITWYFGNEAEAQTMDLGALPTSIPAEPPPTPPSDHFAGWCRVRLGQELQASFSTADNAIRLALEPAEQTLEAARAFLTANSDWDALDVAYVTGENVLDLTTASQLRDPTVIAKIRDVVELVRRTGVRAATLHAWATSAPEEESAMTARRALKARHSEQSWAAAIQPMMDRIREAQRDALVAVLLGRGDFADATELYGHLLVDPEMNACMLTSRIKLAISSVQLFTQRSLMAMEPAVELPVLASKLWVWFKNYRVWEASRKVFFYPENWIEPELRDDKTPFFRELESQIDQGPLDDARVERAFADYLVKLHEVAHLDVVALYEHRDPKGGYTVHVIGRTRSDPRKHFYRARIDDLYWTPWEQVDLEITSDHVIVQVLNRRLFLFWLELSEEREPSPEDNEPGPASYRVQIAWSERREGEWAPRRQSRLSKKTATDDEGTKLENHLLLASGREISVLYDHNGDNDNVVVTTFRYNSCLDQLDEVGWLIDSYSDDEAGKHVSYRTLAQQYRHKDLNDEPSIKLRLLWKQEQQYYTPLDLCHAAGSHRVTLTRQDPQHLGIRPATFDNDSHALYIVPRWYIDYVEPARSAPGDVPPTTGWNKLALNPTTSPAPGPLPPSTPFATLDDVATSAPWNGAVPGMGMVLLDDDTLGASATKQVSATKVSSDAQSIAGGDIELGFATGHDGGGSIPGGAQAIIMLGYRLDPFHHPFTCELRGELNRYGVEGVLASEVEGLKRQERVVVDFVPPGETGDGPHKLQSIVQPPYPVDDFDFSPGGAYSVYNWELFFHVPLYIAERLRKEQRFEEAMRWYHFVFNPLAKKSEPEEGSERFWNIKPFYEEAANGMPDIIKQVFSDGGLDVDPKVAFGFWSSLWFWLKDPFNPHAIARWRPGTYRWAVVQKYLDNLIEWADSLFRRDTIETINEATQLYLLAAAILGPKPKRLPAVDPPVSTFNELTGAGLFGGLVALEDFVPMAPDLGVEAGGPVEPPPTPVWWYFCVPPNDKLLAYWDTVADRLYKIRNCRNIDGVKRQLALFEPPIDPGLLVRARALGLDLAAVIADLQAPLPHYRYRTLAARASELTGDVRAFGSALQQALERKDAEALQELRAGQEVSLLAAVRTVREQQVAEAKANITTLESHRRMVLERRSYYVSKQKLSGREERHIKDLKLATGLTIASQATRLAAGIISTAYPTSFVGSTFQQVMGGQVWASGLNAISDGLAMGSTIVNNRANMAQLRAGYDRRWEDWQFQGEQAMSELNHIERQRLAAEIRLDIVSKELANHDRQAEQAATVETFLRSRYTSQELYTWLAGQLSTLYYQSYKLAYDMAKKAERAMQYELCTEDGFVGYGHWDSLHNGLFAGERLQLDLRRMEAAYLDRDRRHYELTKRVSLRQVDPAALLELRQSGTCDFDVAEVLFDLDHPGHYRRRIKAVSVTIPAVVGPHTTLGAKLTLLEDYTRLEPDLEPEAVRAGYGGISSIATSHARGDSGLFTLDFRDERLLPFEGAGAWSRWRLELPTKVRQFDYDTVTDVELQIQYTALDGGSGFREAVEDELGAAMNAALGDGELALMLSAKAAFPVAWEKFLYPAVGEEEDPLAIPIVLERLPFLLRGLSPAVTHVSLTFVLDADDAVSSIGTDPTLMVPTAPTPTSHALDFLPDPAYPTSTTASTGIADFPVGNSEWTLERNDLTIVHPDRVKDLIVVVRFTVTVPGGA